MASIIKELQQDAINPAVRMSVLLRKALVVAAELELSEFQAWVDNELNGYKNIEEVPAYRRVSGQVIGFSHVYGWRRLFFENRENEQLFSKLPLPYPISHLEDTDHDIRVEYEGEGGERIREAAHGALDVQLHIQGDALRNVVDAVRNKIVEWTIELRKVGVTGDDLTFTIEEKVSAKSVTHISIGTIQNAGIVGSTFGGDAMLIIDQSRPFSDEQLAGLHSLMEQIETYQKELGLQAAQGAALLEAVGEIKSELAVGKPDAGKVRALLASMRNVLEGAAGNVIASGILTAIARFG